MGWMVSGTLSHLRKPLANVVPVGVGLASKGDGRVAAEVLVEKARARQPHPVGVVDAPVRVDEVTVEDLGPLLP